MLDQSKEFQRERIEWRWVVRLLAVVLALTVMPILLGILLDRSLHTFPVITLFMLLLGFTLGIFTIAKSVAAEYARIEARQATPQQVGGDPC